MEEEKKEINEKQKKEKPICDNIQEQVEVLISNILDENIQPGNVDYLYRLVDIHKDIENEKYWKEKIKMIYRGSYGNFDNYSGGRSRDSRGRYMESGNYGNYGRRGYDTKYRGNELMDEMYGNYDAYQETKGMYGAENDKMKSLKYMLKAMEDFGMYLMEDAESEDEKEMIKQALRKMANH